MSSMNEATLEFFIRDSFFVSMTGPQTKFACTLMEQYRESIENAMENYDEETQSWRAYRNAMWGTYVPDAVGAAIASYLDGNPIDPDLLHVAGYSAQQILDIVAKYEELHGTAQGLNPQVRNTLAIAAQQEKIEELTVQVAELKKTNAEITSKLAAATAETARLEARIKIDTIKTTRPANLNAVRAEAHNDNKAWSVSDMLESELLGVLSGERESNSALILYLQRDKGTDKYGTGFAACNLSYSEAIALCGVMSTKFSTSILRSASD